MQSQKAVRTAGVQTEVHAGFTVLQTENTRDTLRLYSNLTMAMQVTPAQPGLPFHAEPVASCTKISLTACRYSWAMHRCDHLQCC